MNFILRILQCVHAGLTQCMTVKETLVRVFRVGLMELLKMQDTALRKKQLSKFLEKKFFCKSL